MRHTIILDFIDKWITEKIYKKAREKEKELLTDYFTARYLPTSIIYWLVIFLIFILITITLGWMEKALLYLLVACSIGSFFIVLYHISYRCYVDDVGIRKKMFWIFKKQILWKDIKKIEIKKTKPYRKTYEKIATFRNKQNKVIFTCSYDLVGFDLIVKKAKNKRKENH